MDLSSALTSGWLQSLDSLLQDFLVSMPAYHKFQRKGCYKCALFTSTVCQQQQGSQKHERQLQWKREMLLKCHAHHY